jgi:hypothetical protein
MEQIVTAAASFPAIVLQEAIEFIQRICADEKGLMAGDAIDPEE